MKLMTYSNPALALFDELLKGCETSRQQPGNYTPVKWSEDDDRYCAQIILPGVKKEQLSIEFNESVVTLSVSQRSETDDEDRSHHFEKRFSVPEGIVAEEAEANLEDGILKLTLPKSPEAKPITITVE